MVKRPLTASVARARVVVVVVVVMVLVVVLGGGGPHYRAYCGATDERS